MAVDLREQLQTSLGEAYRLERELGGGGMSRVFVAVETALERRVVVKVLLPELAAGVSVERFRREIHLAAQLQHPHIVPLLAAGDMGGLPWFTMPFVTGESLRTRLMRDGELPIAETVRILRDVASALAYAHAQGVVHRDIKPDNVLLSHGVAVVTDFGVAKALTMSSTEAALARGGLTSMGVSLGTPAYMAPEQASADPGMDHRVDLYAFGVLGYEMLTGQPPFAGRSPQAILGAHVAALPEPVNARRPGLPPLLVALVMKCLEKRPADRPQTAGELITALDMMTTPSGISAPVHAPTVVVRPPSRLATALRRYGPLAAGVAIAAVTALLVWRPRSVTPPDDSTTPSPAPTVVVPTPSPAAPLPPQTEVPESAAAPPPPAARAEETPSRRRTPAPAPAPRARLASEEAALLARLREQAAGARGRAVAAGVTESVLVEGDVEVAAAESLASRGQVALAAAELSSAVALWSAAAERAMTARVPVETTPAKPPIAADSAPARPPPPPPRPAPDPAGEIRALVVAYATAIEARNLDAIRRVYPSLQPAQAREWEQFFNAVSDIDVELRVTGLEISGASANAQLAGVYSFTDPSSRRLKHENVGFTARLRRDGGTWLIEALR